MNCKRAWIILFFFLSLTDLYSQKILFPYPVAENSFISFTDTNFHCAYLKLNKNESSDFCFFVADNFRGVILSNENFVNVRSLDYFLFNFRLNFLTIKYNVLPYLHPDFVIKFLFLLNKVKYFPRISDAMRTTEEQLKYKKRGWSNVEDSPHMLGLAADLSFYTRYDRNIIQKYYLPLGIRYLEHGGRGNNHIHMQDETLWLTDKTTRTQVISDSLNKKLSENYNIMKPYTENLFAEKFTDGIEVNFNTDNLDLIKVEFTTPIGFKYAELTAGIFENGSHTFYIRPDFLKKGVYCVRAFRNGMYLFQKGLIII
jgi:hypothetical protein